MTRSREELEKEANEKFLKLERERINEYKTRTKSDRVATRNAKVKAPLEQQSKTAWDTVTKEADNKISGMQGFENWQALTSRIFGFGQIIGFGVYSSLSFASADISGFICERYHDFNNLSIELPKLSLVNFSPIVGNNGELNPEAIFNNVKLSDGSTLTPVAKHAVLAGMNMWLNDNGYNLIERNNGYVIQDRAGQPIAPDVFNAMRDRDLNNFMEGNYQMRTVPEAAPMHPTPRP